jgi:hypothetical protein
MSEARRLRYVNQYAASVEPLPFDQPWARWQEKGVRNHARVGRNIRLVGAIAMALGVIWFLA